MEGYLLRYINLVYRFKSNYFILHKDVLSYLEKKGGVKKGTIHLKIAQIVAVSDDPLKIIINSGTSEIVIKFANTAEKSQWHTALKEAQETTYEEDAPLNQLEDETLKNGNLSPRSKSILLDSRTSRINDILAEIWMNHAKMEETLSLLTPHLNQQPQPIKELAIQLEKQSQYLKYYITECVKNVEEERKRILRAANYFTSEKGNQAFRKVVQSTGPANGQEEFEETYIPHPFFSNDKDGFREPGDNGTVFESFIGDDDCLYERKSFDGGAKKRPSISNGNGFSSNQNILQSLQQQQPILKNGRESSADGSAVLQRLIQSVQRDQIKYRFLSSNKIIKQIQWTTEPQRSKLPFEIDPNEKINFLSVIKDSIGKDLSKITMPVFFNQPLSMLQTLAQPMKFSWILDQADQQSDSCLRMAYVMAFTLASYSVTVGCTLKKPFNPMLGETYELDDPVRGFKVICEQVSHHPPISAIHAESNNFSLWGHSQVSQQFWGKSMEMKPKGLQHIQLKKNKDFFSFQKCTTTINNIVFGTMYIDNSGEINYKNQTTGDQGQLQLQEKGWSEKSAAIFTGVVKNAKGQERYKLRGKWTENVVIQDCTTNQEQTIWSLDKNKDLGQPKYYGYDNFVLNLNHINEDLAKSIAATDTRFRPDQRALEHGWQSLAAEEKNRMEEKQRAKRKELEAAGKHHTAKWFTQQSDTQNAEMLEFIYKGGYFEAKQKGDFGETQDIY